MSSRSISITLDRVEVDRGISMDVGVPGRGGNMEHIRVARRGGGEGAGGARGKKNPRGKTALHGQPGGGVGIGC